MLNVVDAPRRPALRWHGGKWRLAPWIISHFPRHRVYVEPFGGAASVLLRKEKSYAEIYNDLDSGVVNLFSVLRSSRSDELIQALRLTPFARDEFEAATNEAADPVEEARRLVIRSFMGFGSNGHNRNISTGFRSNSSRSGSTPASDWVNIPENLNAIVERFRGVVIENRDALQVMAAHDGGETLHYVDPPYLHHLRSQKRRKSGERYHAYSHEMSQDDHVRLLESLKSLAGSTVVSGYPCEIYDDMLAGWTRITRQVFADGARPRVEVLWLNKRCADLLLRQAA